MDLESVLMLCFYISIVLAGYGIGVAARKKQLKIEWLGKLMTVAIILIVVLMGVRIGMNRDIISSFGSIGGMSLVLTVFVMTGSTGAVFIARKLLGIDRKGLRND